MPNVKNQRGEFVAEFAYNPEGKAAANKMAANNPGYSVVDARERGNIPSYRYGGKVPAIDSSPDPYKPGAVDSSPDIVKHPALDSSPEYGRLPRPSKPSSKRPGTVPKYGKGINKRRRFSKGK
jgi:hypothetical protein